MRLLEVLNPDIDTFIRYKILNPQDVDIFTNAHKDISKDEYAKAVLETVVFNLKTDISDILRQMEKEDARRILRNIYNGCVMLNPGLDVDAWLSMAGTENTEINEPTSTSGKEYPPPPPVPDDSKKPKRKAPYRKVTKAKFLGLESHLKNSIIGQDEAIETMIGTLKRSVTGLGDEDRPMGVFLFAGASGVGKTHLAKTLHQYLYGDEFDIVRIDCGEYQHKHENQKLIGSPPGYIGHDEGGYLTNQMKKNPQTVVLLDEVEKAHPDLWNTFLRVFDEGFLTDSSGNTHTFKDAIIIMTTNLGNREAIDSMMSASTGFGGNLTLDIRDSVAPPREVIERHTVKQIQKNFKPEFLNRIDKIVVFNHLTTDDLIKIADIELALVEAKLRRRGMRLTYADFVCEQMIREGVNTIEGARGLSKVRREIIEDKISDALLQQSRWPRGTVVTINWDKDIDISIKKPPRKKKTKEVSSDA